MLFPYGHGFPLLKGKLTYLSEFWGPAQNFTGRADHAISAECAFPLADATIKRTVGTFVLNAPLRVYACDDDTGKHVSCFEIPQVYGFGETYEDAMDMLDREILSMRDDLNDGTLLSAEYEELRKMFSRMFKA